MSDEKEAGSGLVVAGNRGMRPRSTNLVQRGLDQIANMKPPEQPEKDSGAELRELAESLRHTEGEWRTKDESHPFGSVPVFNEATYEAAKPLLIAAAKPFLDKGATLPEALRGIITALRDERGWDKAKLSNFAQYLSRFMKDWQAGKIDFPVANLKEGEAKKARTHPRQELTPAVQARRSEALTKLYAAWLKDGKEGLDMELRSSPSGHAESDPWANLAALANEMEKGTVNELDETIGRTPEILAEVKAKINTDDEYAGHGHENIVRNKWRHGPVRFEALQLGPVLSEYDGLLPFYVVLDPEVGTEVILIIRDQTDFMNTLKAVSPFRLHLKTGFGRNDYGPFGFFLFWIQDPANTSEYVVAYDTYVNPTNDIQLKLWRALAAQTHWHLFLVGASGEQEGFFEFENSYGLNEALNVLEQASSDISMDDFYRAKQEFQSDYSVTDLFNFEV